MEIDLKRECIEELQKVGCTFDGDFCTYKSNNPKFAVVVDLNDTPFLCTTNAIRDLLSAAYIEGVETGINRVQNSIKNVLGIKEY